MITENSKKITTCGRNQDYNTTCRLEALRESIQNMGWGKIAKIAKLAGVNKNKVSRFLDGGEINASSYVAIEKAVLEMTSHTESVA